MNLVLVTGGSNGIGRSSCLELARRGAGVILTYFRHREGADAVVAEIQKAGGQAAALRLDTGDVSSFPGFVAQVRTLLADRWQRDSFDALVNNAGTGGGMAFAELTEEYFDAIFHTNFKGPFFLTQALLPLLADGGRVLNISSNASRGSSPGYSAYGASKAALTSLTRYLAKELSPRGIRVNAISPGPVQSNFGDGAFAKHPEYIAPLAQQTALGRIGQPEDLALVVASVLSDEFRWVTAQDIEVSGGFLL